MTFTGIELQNYLKPSWGNIFKETKTVSEKYLYSNVHNDKKESSFAVGGIVTLSSLYWKLYETLFKIS